MGSGTNKLTWAAVLAGVALVVGLPLLGHWARQTPADRCALDGMRVEPLYRVRVVDAGGRSHEFCCLKCAETWLKNRREAPRAVYVTDEAGGGEVEAAAAYFVRSLLVTEPTTGNRVHAFRRREDAEAHAQSARGVLLTGDERPFATPAGGGGRE